MICYRVVRHKYADLSGEGARLYGGRFNPAGIPAVYSSQSIALALLEVLVHIEKTEVPSDYVVMAIRFEGHCVSRPQSAKLLGASQLPTQAFRNAYYRRPILRVPSVIIPREYNYVLFPEANTFHANIDWAEPLNFDRRLAYSAAR